jgi:hypothetical protein
MASNAVAWLIIANILFVANVTEDADIGGPHTYEITIKGRNLVVMLNGKETAKLHNGMFEEGPFALQHGAGVIKFRKVAIKPL